MKRFVEPRTARYPTHAGAWDGERIVAAMLAWRDECGVPPRSYEWAPQTGRDMGMLGPEPQRWELEYPRWPSTGAVVKHFGSWCAGLRAAGVPARIPERALPLTERVAVARRLRAEGWLQREIADFLQVTVGTVRGYLTAEDCPRCGRPITTAWLGRGARSCQACAARKSKATARTKPEIIRALHAWVALEGSPPKRDDWIATPNRGRRRHPRWARDYPRWPSASEVVTRFGTWNDALQAAGLPRRLSPRWSAEAVAAAIRSWTERHGRTPRPSDWRDATPGEHPDRSTVLRLFGSWEAALRRAV